jgi:phage-related protein
VTDPELKAAAFVGSSRQDLKLFPRDARREAGYQLERLQAGENPTHWKPMREIGSGVGGIRIHDETGAFRVIYVASFSAAVYILHAFQKKSQATARKDIELAKSRYRTIIARRDLLGRLIGAYGTQSRAHRRQQPA